MKKAKESTFDELTKWLNEFGWEKGIKILETNLLKTEWLQAHLYGEGDYKSINEANKLSLTIIKMQITLGKLRQLMPNEQKVERSVATEAE